MGARAQNSLFAGECWRSASHPGPVEYIPLIPRGSQGPFFTGLPGELHATAPHQLEQIVSVGSVNIPVWVAFSVEIRRRTP